MDLSKRYRHQFAPIFFNAHLINCEVLKNLFICTMYYKTILTFALANLCIIMTLDAQVQKIDTTAFFGVAGYRVTCSNKKEDVNQVSISPKKFKTTIRDVSFMVKGRLTKILVDDLNDDGFPDLLLCLYTGTKNEKGSIVGIYSNETAIMPVAFPDIFDDAKLREGYKGFDEFTIMMGSLLRSFPIYKATDTDTATGGTRVIQYKIVPNAEKRMIFKVLRTYMK
ncbi:MAG: hypothetical protein H7320_18135 [Ferruginibacter sp.]|nr:hypothetical protein [Ferruginibacter sp.]